MNSLLQELVDEISSFLGNDNLKNTLLVSRKFQYAAERASGAFAFFAFKEHNPEERQNFLTRFGGHRFRCLWNVEVFTSLSSLEHVERLEPRGKREIKQCEGESSADSGPCRESVEDLNKKDEIFTEQIRFVWKTVHTAEGMQNDDVGKMQIRIFTPTRWVDEYFYGHRRYSSWRLHLLSLHELPKLHSVRSLSICNLADKDKEDEANHCKLDLRVNIDLASRCPNLEYLGCKLGADEWADSADPWMEQFMHDYPGCRRDTRNDFASAIQSIALPTTLQHVQLDFINEVHPSVQEQCRPMPNLVSPNHYDPFSSSLRLLSQQLRRMELHIVTDNTLFWPSEYNADPSWPNLEILSVMFYIGAPSGEWYFQSPRGGKE